MGSRQQINHKMEISAALFAMCLMPTLTLTLARWNKTADRQQQHKIVTSGDVHTFILSH